MASSAVQVGRPARPGDVDSAGAGLGAIRRSAAHRAVQQTDVSKQRPPGRARDAHRSVRPARALEVMQSEPCSPTTSSWVRAGLRMLCDTTADIEDEPGPAGDPHHPAASHLEE
jgi:hypothetical protein